MDKKLVKSIGMPESVWGKLYALSKKNDRTVTGEINAIIRGHISNVEARGSFSPDEPVVEMPREMNRDEVEEAILGCLMAGGSFSTVSKILTVDSFSGRWNKVIFSAAEMANRISGSSNLPFVTRAISQDDYEKYQEEKGHHMKLFLANLVASAMPVSYLPQMRDFLLEIIENGGEDQ